MCRVLIFIWFLRFIYPACTNSIVTELLRPALDLLQPRSRSRVSSANFRRDVDFRRCDNDQHRQTEVWRLDFTNRDYLGFQIRAILLFLWTHFCETGSPSLSTASRRLEPSPSIPHPSTARYEIFFLEQPLNSIGFLFPK